MRAQEPAIDQHSSELGRWQTLQRAADPRLRAYVRGYFASSSHLRVPVLERHLPSTEVPLLLNFGEAHRRRIQRTDGGDATDAQWSSHADAWIVGLHTQHQLTRATGERHFMVVRFTPLGAHLFLGIPMHAIANDAVDLERIDPAIARAVMDKVARVRGWHARFAAMDALIAAHVADAAKRRLVTDAASGAVAHVWQRLVATDGAVALGPLADELDCSRRALIARFRTSVGFPPKTIARLLRFNRVVRALDRARETRADESVGKPYIESAHPHERHIRDGDARLSRSIRWAEIAADCGYFDQAHLIKDFREFAGRTPTAFLRSVTDLG